MLYITTRNNKDAFTASRTINQDLAPDGGFYVPFCLSAFSTNEIVELKDKSFGDTVAQILNLFFSSRLNGWDVDFCIGRNPVKHTVLNHKTVIAEMWHNPDAKFDYVIQNLYRRVCPDSCRNATEWFRIAARIAMIFASFGEMLRQNLAPSSDIMDVVVPGDDLTACTAVILAKKMGLPIKSVICGCSEGASVLELLRRGTFNTKVSSGVNSIERLLHSCVNSCEVLNFAECCKHADIYSLQEDALSVLNQSLFVAAVSQERTNSVIRSTYQTSRCLIDDKTAMALAGLQDYRTSSGENRMAMVMMDVNPAISSGMIL